MGTDFGIVQVVQGISYFFPSLSKYTTIISPIAVFVFSVISIFSNILPEPGSAYPVPEVDDIKSELTGSGRLVYRFSLISRKVTLTVNQFISSRPYKWFYAGIDFFSRLVTRLKGESKISSLVKITKPTHHKIEIHTPSENKDEDR